MVIHQESKVSEYLLIESLWNLTMKKISQLSLMEKNMSNKKVNLRVCTGQTPRSTFHQVRLNHPTSALMANYSGIRTLERSNSAFPVA